MIKTLEIPERLLENAFDRFADVSFTVEYGQKHGDCGIRCGFHGDRGGYLPRIPPKRFRSRRLNVRPKALSGLMTRFFGPREAREPAKRSASAKRLYFSRD